MRHAKRIKYAVLMLVISTACFFYCSKQDKTQMTPVMHGGLDSSVNSFPVKSVNIIHYSFVPLNVIIMHGASVSWTNKDSVSHTVTSISGAFDSPELKPGNFFFFTFQQAGTYDYYCKFHKEPGKIIVQ